MPRHRQDGFSLIELLVVVIIIGILAAIAIPRFLSQQEKGNDAAAISDLRNLVAIQTGLEARSGLTDSAAEIHGEGWRGTNQGVRVCALLQGDPVELTLTAWHLGGSLQYVYTRPGGVIESSAAPSPQETCPAQGAPGVLVWPYTP